MKKRASRTGADQARRVMRKLADNPFKQVMFGVEAESDGEGGAILTITDINARRRLYQQYGQHNVRVSMKDMLGLGYPPKALKVLTEGYPVVVGMPVDVYEGLITSGGFSGYDGDEEDPRCPCGGPIVSGPGFQYCQFCGRRPTQRRGADEEEGDGSRPVYVIAREIAREWKKPYFGAVPYLRAMTQLRDINDRYGADSAKSIITYFLANASTWRGGRAREIKAELKQLAGIR